VFLLGADAGLDVGRRGVGVDAVAGEVLEQVGRALDAQHRYVDVLFKLGLHPHLAELADAPEDQRVQQRRDQQAEQEGAAVAEEVAPFLAHHREHAAEERSPVHACKPSSLPISLTKASSRLASPVAARSSSGVPCAATRPCAMTTMR